MRTASVLVLSLLQASLGLAFGGPAFAQSMARSPEVAAPDYGSAAASGFLSNTRVNTPESDGRPGVRFFSEGKVAYSHRDIEHAINRLELSAFWAYEPAAYNLGILYFKGEGGFPVDRPLGTAWMFIAAENGSSMYEWARHVMVTSLDDSERSEAWKDYQRLEQKYGHAVAMHRAKAQWSLARTRKTGSRVGAQDGNLKVGLHDGSGSLAGNAGTTPSGATISKQVSTSFQVLNGASMDGSIAYRQMEKSSNPYDVRFLRNPTGTATVGQLRTIGDKTPPPAEPSSSGH